MIKEILAIGILVAGCAPKAPDTGKTLNIGFTDTTPRIPTTLQSPTFRITRLSKDVFWIEGDSIRDKSIQSGLGYINNRCKILGLSDLGSGKAGYGGDFLTTIVAVVDDGKCIPEIEPLY